MILRGQCILLAACVLLFVAVAASALSQNSRVDADEFTAELISLALDPNFGPAQNRVVKWTGSLRYGIHGKHVDGIARVLIEDQMHTLRELTGLDIAEAEPASTSENFSIFFMIASERNALRSDKSISSTTTFNEWDLKQQPCAYEISTDHSSIQQATVYIKAEAITPITLNCIQEYLSRAMGIVNRPSLSDSVFALEHPRWMMTEKDKLFLRVLYSPKLQAGVDVEQARRTIKSIYDETAQ